MSTRTANGKADAEQALTKQAHKYEEGLTKGDVETLDKLWTPDYTFVNPRGELLNKAERIANIKSGATEFETMRRHKERLLAHGDFAVEVGRIVVQGEYSGRESSGEYRYTTAWIKIRGRWQMLANQITLIATKTWLRPPPDQRACGLDTVNFLPQQLVAHAQISDQRFQPLGFFVLDIGFPRFQVRFHADERLLPSAGERCRSHAQFARECLDVFTT